VRNPAQLRAGTAGARIAKRLAGGNVYESVEQATDAILAKLRGKRGVDDAEPLPRIA